MSHTYVEARDEELLPWVGRGSVTLARGELSARDCHLWPRLFQEEVRTQQAKTLARASRAFGARILRRPKGLLSAIG